MAFNFKKSVTFHLGQTAKAHRARAGVHLGRIGLHAGQEAVMKMLSEEDGQTMTQLAVGLGVQPPTVTKMVTRLSGQGLVRRAASEADGRLARVYLTEVGNDRIAAIDKAWKRLEKEALIGIDDKDRKKLRKLLRQVTRNLAGSAALEDLVEDDMDGEAEEKTATLAPVPSETVAS